MDWSGGAPSGYTVTSWQELVEKNQRSANSEVLSVDKDSQVPPVSVFVPTASGGHDLVKYTSQVSEISCCYMFLFIIQSTSLLLTLGTDTSLLTHSKEPHLRHSSPPRDAPPHSKSVPQRHLPPHHSPNRFLHSSLDIRRPLLQRQLIPQQRRRRQHRPPARDVADLADNRARLSSHADRIPQSPQHETSQRSRQIPHSTHT